MLDERKEERAFRDQGRIGGFVGGCMWCVVVVVSLGKMSLLWLGGDGMVGWLTTWWGCRGGEGRGVERQTGEWVESCSVKVVKGGWG